jgi:hypothetical protein
MGVPAPLSMTFNFGDNFHYSIPYYLDVNDGDKFYCYITVTPRTDGINQVEIGLPFF